MKRPEKGLGKNLRMDVSRAEKNSMGNQFRAESRKESRIGSDPILFLTIFPRLWPRLSSRFLVTNVTILLFYMVISSPRTGSSRDNTTATSWKLEASFEIFLSTKLFCKLNLTKGFYFTYLKVYKKVGIFFSNGGYDGFFFESMFFNSAGSIRETIFIQSTRNFAPFFD